MRFLPRLLMLVSLAAPLAHAELLDDVHQRGALRIALEGTYPPFNFKQGGKLTGFETELGELLPPSWSSSRNSSPPNGAASSPAYRAASTTSR